MESSGVCTIFVILYVLTCLPWYCSSDDSPGEGIQPISDSDLGLHIGDKCVASCSSVIKNSICNTTTNTCQCQESHPIAIEGVACVDVKDLHQSCSYDQQCNIKNADSYCFQFDRGDLRCWCKPGFHSELIQENPIKYGCLEDFGRHLSKHSVSALTALTIGLSILSCLLCLMFRIFTRSHWGSRSRSQYAHSSSTPTRESGRRSARDSRQSSKASQGKRNSADSTRSGTKRNSHDAPEIMLHGDLATERHLDSLDIEKQIYRPALFVANKSPLPGTSPGGPSSRNNSLTTSSGENSRRPSGQFCEEWPEGFTDGDADYEQRITIVPNPRSKRRRSMADYAFPELHSRSKGNKEPENLLILTRTRVDKHGRRHSVAVPLVPPPDGEKFEGGYHVERNPITGGAKLVPPATDSGRRRSYDNGSRDRRRGSRDKSARSRPESRSPVPTANSTKSVISGSGVSGGSRSPAAATSSASLLGPPPATGFSRFDRKSSRYRNRTISGLPTIGEANQPNHSRARRSASDRGASRRANRTQSQKVTAQTTEIDSAQQAGRARRMSLQVSQPGQANGGVASLSRDMERLKVGGAHAGADGSLSTGVSPRPLKRKTSSRRSSRSSFLHFLDLAIAK